jgi:small subunit ribosomal protein S6
MIFDPNLGEENIGTVVSKIENKIKTLDGEVQKTDKWGVRRLASMLTKARKLKQGYYVFIAFKAEPSVPAKVQSTLKVTEEIVRYSLIRVEEKQPAEIEGAPLPEAGIEAVNVGELRIKKAEESSGQS